MHDIDYQAVEGKISYQFIRQDEALGWYTHVSFNFGLANKNWKTRLKCFSYI